MEEAAIVRASSPEGWTLVAGEPLDAASIADLDFAWRAVRAPKSNAIVLASLGKVEQALNESVVFPALRRQVVAALESLSDPALQAKWGKVQDGVNYFDDLTVNVHVLYDDCMVLPEPQTAVPGILLSDEVNAMSALEEVLGSLIRELGDRPDGAYLTDPRWAGVMSAARAAFLALSKNG